MEAVRAAPASPEEDVIRAALIVLCGFFPLLMLPLYREEKRRARVPHKGRDYASKRYLKRRWK